MSAPKKREEIDKALTWDVESVYPTPEAWETDFARLNEFVKPVAALRGELNSPAKLAEVFAAEDELGKFIERLHLFAHMMEDQDTSAGANQARMSRMRGEYARIAGETAWVTPEILRHSEEQLALFAEALELAPYKRTMTLLLRDKPHTLSAEEETLLGRASDVLQAPYDAFSKLTNADMTFADAEDSQGNKHTVTDGTVFSLYQNEDRVLRENAFRSHYAGYSAHENTLAALLSGRTKTNVFNASIRKYPSALDASLHRDNVPATVYRSLIAAVNDALPAYQDYLRLRAKSLGLEGQLNVWDIHLPIVPEFKLDVTWNQCREWVLESVKPLGDEYYEAARASFTDRWYDVYENKGKRSGGYSTGAYGQKPFILLNYHDKLNDVFTTAHELGHSMHSYLSHANQPYRYADYPIFLAEIASTTNEALLHHHLMETQTDPKLRAYLLNHLCDSFRGTLFRQTMFAEVELEIHERIEKGGALTAESLSDYYYDLNAKYHGDVIDADQLISREWSRIPHFYYNFYVYKYATGFTAAQIFHQRVLRGGAERDAYLGFLKSGSTNDPLDTVKKAGVDLTNPDALQSAFAGFRAAVSELSELLDQLKTTV